MAALESISPPGSPGTDVTAPDPESAQNFKTIASALEQQIILYNDACAQRRAHPQNADSQSEVDIAAKNVASTLREASNLHPNPATGAAWRKMADDFVNSTTEKREDTLKQVGNGLLKIVLAPLALAGVGIYAAGEIVTGAGVAVGSILTGAGAVLKGIGKFGKEALLDLVFATLFRFQFLALNYISSERTDVKSPSHVELKIDLMAVTSARPTHLPQTMPDIPYEIWVQITQYLSPEEVKRLYPVNRSLFNIAMDERYKRGFVGVLSSADTHRSLIRLLDPSVAARVRTFTLKPADLCRMLAEFKPVKYERMVSYMYAGLRKSIARSNDTGTPLPAGGHGHNSQGQGRKIRVEHALPADKAKKHLKKIMHAMTGLTTLVVEILTSQEHRAFQGISISDSSALLQPGWHTFGSNLKSLDLRVPLEDMARVLPTTQRGASETLPSLETLAMHVRHAVYTTSDSDILLNIVLPFLQAQKHSLRSLTLDVGPQVDISLFLLSMENFPLMASFHIKQFFSRDGQGNLKGLYRLLQTQQEHLTDLSIDLVPHSGNLPPVNQFFSQKCFAVSLPNLNRLTINLHQFPSTYKAGLIRYVYSFAESLTYLSVDLDQQYCTSEDVQTLTKPFKEHRGLRELRLSVLEFGPSLLNTLAQNLPRLGTLHLSFRYLQPDGYISRQSLDPLVSHSH
uniref:F-box domain-containing protein n=1 Tax=Psilocybe cubensis TaxID=181762 RepID=A0A8H7Y2P2_PSICU